MTAKMLLLLVIYASIAIADIQRLKNLDKRGIIAYIAMLLLSVYLGINYVFELKWPFLEEAAAELLGEPSRRIVEFLKVPS